MKPHFLPLVACIFQPGLFAGELAAGKPVPPPVAEKPAEPKTPADSLPVSPFIPAEKASLHRLFLQDEGALLGFGLENGLIGWPVAGSWEFKSAGEIVIKSGDPQKPEVLPVRAEWKDGILFLSKHATELPTPLDPAKQPPPDLKGQKIYTKMVPLTLTEPNIAAWVGEYVILKMVAGGKEASGRPVTLDKEGYFRTEKGGHYFRLVAQKDAKCLAYSSNAEDKTVEVQLYVAGNYLVVFDNLLDPSLLAILQKKK